MTFSLHQAESTAAQYAAKHQIQLGERLGFGMDGAVWKSSRNSAIKVIERNETYFRERDCYRRLLEDEVTVLAGFVVPYLIDYDNILQVVEMSIVAPPCVLDFGKAYLDQPSDFSAEALATLWADREVLYEPHQWPLVRKVLAALRGHGIHYFDPQPGNIRFPPEKQASEQPALGSNGTRRRKDSSCPRDSPYNTAMATALLGLGSNLDDRAAALSRSIELLKEEPRIRVEAVSSFHQSKPAGGPEGQGEFLNAAVRLETSLSPEELLASLQAIEDQIGRVREERWGPRMIDLDLLLYDQVEMKTPTLELPHPRMCYRRFVLEPAAEIAGEMVWPVNGWSVATLRHNLDTSAKYIAISKSDILTLRDVLSRIEFEVECRILWEPAEERLPPGNHMRRLSREIECSSWRRESIWRISDFWYDQLSVQFECLLATHPEAANAIRLWETVRRDIVQPRLVIILEDPVHWWILANDTRPASLATEFIFDIRPGHSAVHKEFYSRMRQFCRRADCPPALWLPSEDREQVEREVLAAMQAME